MLVDTLEVEEFIRPEEIEALLTEAAHTPDSEIEAILNKASRFAGLSHLEVASLLKMDDKHLLTLLCRDLSELSTYAMVDNRQFRLVKLGSVVDSGVLIDSGLEPGERYIVEGLMKARPGTVVKHDARTDRLRVYIDADNRITAARCE